MRARGFDVSEYNNVDWKNVPKEWTSFVGIRAGSGGGHTLPSGNPEGAYTDKKLASHYAGAKSIAALVFPYWYCMMGNTPEAEADAAWKVIGQYQWDLPLGMDVEYENDLLHIPIDTQIDWIVRFGNRFQQLSGVKPMLYSFSWQFMHAWNTSARANDLGQFYYWPADLSSGSPPSETANPKMPAYFKDWLFWQTSGNAPKDSSKPSDGSSILPGFYGRPIDQDVFNGTVDDLSNFSQGLSWNNSSTPLPNLPFQVKKVAQAASNPLLTAGIIVGVSALAYRFLRDR
jgi:GH25 family lysozyme M1 (1,4-beta-N-acetylmuramidase)